MMNLKRPTTVAEMRESQAGFATEKAIALGLAYVAQRSDVISLLIRNAAPLGCGRSCMGY
jgi:hypothetical protein